MNWYLPLLAKEIVLELLIGTSNTKLLQTVSRLE